MNDQQIKEEEEANMANNEGGAAAVETKYKVPAPIFSGDGTSRAAISREYHQFTKKFEAYRTALDLKDDQLVAAAALCFKKESSAEKWFYNLERMETVETWDQLKGHMATRFAEEWDAAALLQERVKLQQKQGESVDQFCDRIEDFQIVVDETRKQQNIPNAAVRLLHKSDVYTIFLGGLKEPMKSNLLKRTDLEDLEALRKAAKKEETYVQQRAAIAALDGGGCGGGFIDALGQKNQNPNQKGKSGFLSWPTKRPKWVTLRMMPRDHCAVCAKQGHRGADCKTPLDQQEWDKLLPAIQSQKKGNGGGNGGGNRSNGSGGGGSNNGGKGPGINIVQVGTDANGVPIFQMINNQPPQQQPPPSSGGAPNSSGGGGGGGIQTIGSGFPDLREGGLGGSFSDF